MEADKSSGIKLDLTSFLAITALMLPLSLKVFFPIIGSVLIFPGEIFIGIISLFFLYEFFIQKRYMAFGVSFLTHPITVIVFLYLFINIIAAAFSTMFIVSLKALIVKTSYIVVFYFFIYTIAIQKKEDLLQLFRYYGLGMILVIIYTFLNMSKLGFNRAGAGFACHPFYNDHTIYSAAMALLLPPFIAQSLFKTKLLLSKYRHYFAILVTLFASAAFFFSFCRAAWLSMLVAVIFFTMVLAGLRFRGIFITFIIILSTTLIFRNTIYDSIKENRNDSNKTGVSITEHIGSFTNITNDYSNKERLNRWYSSIQMFRIRPLVGFGPGTYQFQYLPFQSAKFTSYLSLMKPLRPGFGTFYWHSNVIGLIQDNDYTWYQGGGGTAHSEYFLELAETGVISMTLFILLLFASIYSGLRVYSKTKDKGEKILSLAILIGLLTYFVHAGFNNFLDDCKIAFLFWASLAYLTAMDVKQKQMVNSQG